MEKVVELDRCREPWQGPPDDGGGGSAGALVRAAKAGDRQAWTELVHQYSRVISGTARRFRLNDADAADVVQAVWLRLFENLGGLRDPERVVGWLKTTAQRECIGLAKRRGKIANVENLDVADDSRVPEALVVAESERVQLVAALRRLPARDQRLLALLMASPMPGYAEISRQLGMPVGSIGPTRARALTRLRREYLQSASAA